MIDWIYQIDTSLFLLLNGANNAFFDVFFSLFTSKEIWYPFYLVLLMLLFQKHREQAILIVIALVVAIILSDQIPNLVKIMVKRWRPTHDPAIKNLVHNTFVGPGGDYGFFSSHAANAFALAIFISKIIGRKSIWLIMTGWALLTAYSRIYVGVHFPLDVICGAIVGALLGWMAYRVLIYADTRFFRKEISKNGIWKVSQYSIIWWVMIFTVVTLLLVSFLVLKYKLAF